MIGRTGAKDREQTDGFMSRTRRHHRSLPPDRYRVGPDITLYLYLCPSISSLSLVSSSSVYPGTQRPEFPYLRTNTRVWIRTRVVRVCFLISVAVFRLVWPRERIAFQNHIGQSFFTISSIYNFFPLPGLIPNSFLEYSPWLCNSDPM